MQTSQWDLLKSKRFLPLFLTQFFGAFNDNIFKNALVILITYEILKSSSLSPKIMVTLAAGIFILPFFLFSATAGQLADKFDKAKLIRAIKIAEIIIMSCALIGFIFESLNFLMFVLFLMGTQSAYFGPVKYGILPDQLSDHELIGGNALVEAGTFTAILIGTIIGGLFILAENGITIISVFVIFFATTGWISSLYIPSTKPAAPDLNIGYNFIYETYSIIRNIKQNPVVFRSIIGISWFWFFGATFLSQFPIFAKDVVNGNEEIVTLFLAIFSIGIGIGSLLCNKLLKGEIVAKYVPFGILGMTVFTVDLFFAAGKAIEGSPSDLIGVVTFLSAFVHWRILLDLFLISVSAGIYIVPLYAIMQNQSEGAFRSRTIAGNNVMNALFMVISALAIMFMFGQNFSVVEIFLTIGICNGLVSIYIFSQLPKFSKN